MRSFSGENSSHAAACGRRCGHAYGPQCSEKAGGDGEQGKNTEARQRKRAANQDAGEKAEQGKNARQIKRSANQEAGGKAEQGKNTEARQ